MTMTPVELEIIARDAPMSYYDKRVLREAAEEMRVAFNDCHTLRNYSVELEQRNAAQGERIKGLEAEIQKLKDELARRLPELPPKYGDGAYLRVLTGQFPSWSMFPHYRLNHGKFGQY